MEIDWFTYMINISIRGNSILQSIITDRQLLLSCGAALLLAVIYAPFSYDEAFITYRYAHNLAEGNGLVFNIGDSYLGTTGPGWAVFLGALHWLIPRVQVHVWSSIFTAILLVGLTIAIYLLVSQIQGPTFAWLPAILVVANPLVIKPLGGEVIPQLFLITIAWLSIFRGHTWRWGVFAGLATWVRGDAAIALPVLGLTALLRQRQLPWKAAVAYGITLLPWVAFSLWQFGQPWPSTIQTKTAQCRSGMWICFAPGLLRWISTGFTYRFEQILGLVGMQMLAPIGLIGGTLSLISLTLVGLLSKLRQSPEWLLMLGWPALHLITYIFIRAPFYPWYATVLGWGLGLALGLGIIGLLSQQQNRHHIKLALLLGICILIAYSGWHVQHRLTDVPDARQSVHLRLAEWIRSHTDATDTIMSEEIGFLAYYLPDRTVYETWGLVTPGAADNLLSGELEQVVRRYCPDYFLAFPARDSGFRKIPLNRQFQAAYTPVAQIHETGLHYAPTITIYKAKRPCT